ncbi:SRPBCC domain-containing protein [Cryomorphaceae bacterium]|nr:SRPBCC domain-containing protein [Cryomorphaceae bacterium]
MRDHIELDEYFDISPSALYTAWLTGEEHAAMTGGAAESVPEVGTDYTAWDEYIWGQHLELVPDQRIVQSWRSTEFAPNEEDSVVTITLTPEGSGTRLHLSHTDIPTGDGERYRKGWIEHYFTPMKKHFSS